MDWRSLLAEVSGWDILIAVLVVAAGWILSVFAKRWARSLVRRIPNSTEGGAVLAGRIAQYTIILVAVGIALGFFGASVQPLIAVAIIIAVVIALVLRGVADNFAAGVLLQTRHPIGLGDEIEVEGGHVGRVVELNGRTVVIRTLDGRTVHVPNATVAGSPIVNHSEAGARRSEIEVRIARPGGSGGAAGAGGADTPAHGDAPGSTVSVVAALTAAVAGIEGVHRREPVRTLVIAESDERIVARVQFWHHPTHGVPVRSEVVQAVAAALRSAGWSGTVTSERPEAPLTSPDRV